MAFMAVYLEEISRFIINLLVLLKAGVKGNSLKTNAFIL